MLKKNLLVSFLESEYVFNVIMVLAYFSGVDITLQIMPCATPFPYHNSFCKKLIEFFYNYDNYDGGSIPQIVVDNTRNHVV